MNSQYSRVVISQLGRGQAAGSLRAGLGPCSPKHPPPLPAAIPAATMLPTPTPMLHNLPLPRHSSGHQWGNNRQQGRVGSRAQAGCPHRCNPPALGADAAGPALDLAVHVGKARVVGFGLVGADLQAGGRRAKVRVWPQALPAAPHAWLVTRHHSGTQLVVALGSYRPLGDVVWPHVGWVGCRFLACPCRRRWVGGQDGSPSAHPFPQTSNPARGQPAVRPAPS